MVFDVTQAASFDRAKSWIKELCEKAEEVVVIALVANKVDLDAREISSEVLAERMSAHRKPKSTRTGTNLSTSRPQPSQAWGSTTSSLAFLTR